MAVPRHRKLVLAAMLDDADLLSPVLSCLRIIEGVAASGFGVHSPACQLQQQREVVVCCNASKHTKSLLHSLRGFCCLQNPSALLTLECDLWSTLHPQAELQAL